ncbi:MAG: DNA gyrase subunit A [Gemmatimonadales bacterium]|jgi:DNA gyrase subunit A|nr:DNA gyrase subunit A [Gemmatimonadales bacterium]MDG2239646.1 DNA gyrase subunit A [Longimicrobiales bacterium]NCG31990.1 DNA gyrase subunit A [Pseudomonadota bacterium]MBT3500248.1 DNA gyrase subunit A [Gemmatimonadales bacterium]MBT3775601.1 DNA gyrase subunit A [Gemmatimonadales bacterium]
MATASKRERILPRLLEEEMRESFLDYSMSVIVQRALPDVRDGLKPVHRRILYAMYELGLNPDKPYKKSATVVGNVLGKYHPHGDSAVYDTLVRMVQDFSLRMPLIDGQGNFGSIDGDSAAAYRYTEARLEAIAVELLDDIGKETVNFQPNFDNQLEEPIVLPARFPNLLVNGSSGIAVGMSTNVPPHNLREIAAGVRQLVVDPDCTVDDLMRHIPGPDFPTGGFVVGREGIDKMYRESRGRVIMRARAMKESRRGGREQLVVTELPYAVSKTKIIEQIAKLAKAGRAEDVSDIRDETDRDGIRLVIELKRGAHAGTVLNMLYKRTSLQTTFGAHLLALDDGQPKEFDLKRMLECFRDHRVEVIQRRCRFELEKAEAEKHVLEGLLAALKHIDEVIKIIRGSKDRSQARERLRDRFGLSEIQADAILNMRLAKLTALERSQLEARLAELAAVISELRKILESEEIQLQVMLDELAEVVEKYGDARRTVLLDDEDAQADAPAAVEAQLADEDVVVTLSAQGYVSRIPMHLYRRRVGSGKALAGMERYEDDYLERLFVARTQGWILTFTEGGHCHFLRVADVPESARASRGKSVYSLLDGADRSDKIVSMIPVDNLSVEGRFLVFLSKLGTMKRTSLSEFSNARANGIKAAGVKGGDVILDVAMSDGTAELMLLSRSGRAIRFPEEQISIVGRTAAGVKGMSLKDDEVIGMLLIRRDSTVLTVSEDGLGKRTPIDDFPLQNRGGMGNLFTPTSGDVSPIVCALEVMEADEVMIITAGGQVTRAAADSVPVQGRRTQGKSMVAIPEGDRVVEVTRASGRGGAPARDDVGEEENEGQLDLLG